jgi:isoaspartyl peptidase/L-asparaginase-like protein (Ntn-hydrolase superfamily)|tara:strand:+ start:1747 stop:1950 length:204 start_codon:yes stop_codon:yes gene_type:complete
MTGKIKIELEGDAYADGIATADKFIETITDKLSKIQELAEANLDAVDAIADAIKHLENAKEALHGED